MNSGLYISSRIGQLDGFRGVFSLMIVMLHFPAQDSFLTNNFFVRQSYLFVDFFFVLSGFIIASNYLYRIQTTADFKEYFLKRLIRLYPLLLFTVLVYFCYLLIGEFFFSNIKEEHKSIVEYVLELFDSLLFMNSTPLLGTSQGINPPSWSISAEVISYFIFGLGVLHFKRFIDYYYLLIILICIAFMASSGSFTFNGNYGFVRGLLGFNFGVLAFRISEKAILHKYLRLPALIGLVLAFFFIDVVKVDLYKLIFPPLFALIILVFLNPGGLINRVLSGKIFQFLGRISYSLYLNHYLTLMVFYIVSFRILDLKIVEPNLTFVLFVNFAFLLLYSHFTYRLIELKSGQYLKRKLLEERTKA